MEKRGDERERKRKGGIQCWLVKRLSISERCGKTQKQHVKRLETEY